MVIDKKVNYLPVLTWNKLGFNYAVLREDVEINKAGTPEEVLPEGVTPGAELTTEELQTYYKEHDITLTREAVVAGKYAMYMEQDFPTGMGVATDEILEQTGTKTRIYEVAEHTKVDGTFRLKYVYEDGDAGLDSVLIHVGKYSEVTVVQYFTGKEGKGFVGSTTRIILEEGAKAHLIKVEILPKEFCYYDDFGARLMRRSDLEFTRIALGAGKAYVGANVDQVGAESHFYSDMGYIGEKDSFLDFNYVDTFRGKKTEGVMRFNGVLFDNAVKVSRETLDYRQYCHDASGDEQEDILVLGPDTVNKANPMILGEEEKVNGRHAVTIGKLSPEMLFYMQTRGIDKKTVEEIMVRAGINRVSHKIPDEEIQKDVDLYIDAIYGKQDE